MSRPPRLSGTSWNGSPASSPRLMVFAEWIEEFKITCPNTHFTAGGIAHCEVCDENGSAATSEKKSGWVPAAGSLTGWLADWSGVDLAKLEAEKRAMLDAIRAQNLTTEPKAASA